MQVLKVLAVWPRSKPIAPFPVSAASVYSAAVAVWIQHTAPSTPRGGGDLTQILR